MVLPLPRIEGPITGGRHNRPFSASTANLDAFGYIEEEFFIEGRARNYLASGELTPDGKWQVAPADEAPYRTRLLVRRPRDAKRFNGTVVLEWINVTAGFELALMGGTSEDIYRSGFAHVIVSAQVIGHEGFAKNSLGLKRWDAERYGSLSISGDSYSYDIFAQAGRAVGPRHQREGVNPLEDLDVKTIIATGASQSAIRLRGYVNSIHHQDPTFDGILTTLDFGTVAGFDDWVYDPTVLPLGDTGRLFTIPSRIRDDIKVPLIVVNSEFETLRILNCRQPDSDLFRFWEVAGSSHMPAADGLRLKTIRDRDGLGPGIPFATASVVQWQPTADAALDHMQRWINGGEAAPSMPSIEVSTDGTPTISRDEFGNAIGGVRVPEVDAPIAAYDGTGRGEALLAGVTTPFSNERLRALYPTADDYVDRVKAAAQKAFDAGVISAAKRDSYISNAKADWL